MSHALDGDGGGVRKVVFQVNGFRLEYDRAYGVDLRSGWSVTVGGHMAVELEPNLLTAVRKALGALRRGVDL
mgnify:CR=1 FL=1